MSKESKPAKIEAVKAMRDLGYHYSDIVERLGIPERTAHRYARETTSEEWQEFGLVIKRLISLKENELLADVLSELQEKMNRAQYKDLVSLYKELKQKETAPQNQINIASGEMSIEFVKE
jgi:predicted transcriptional regulator